MLQVASLFLFCGTLQVLQSGMLEKDHAVFLINFRCIYQDRHLSKLINI